MYGGLGGVWLNDGGGLFPVKSLSAAPRQCGRLEDQVQKDEGVYLYGPLIYYNR